MIQVKYKIIPIINFHSQSFNSKLNFQRTFSSTNAYKVHFQINSYLKLIFWGHQSTPKTIALWAMSPKWSSSGLIKVESVAKVCQLKCDFVCGKWVKIDASERLFEGEHITTEGWRQEREGIVIWRGVWRWKFW